MKPEKSSPKLFQRADPETAKTEFLPRIRVSSAEYELVMEKVSDSGRSYSEFALNAILGKPMRSYVSATIINQLRIIAETQKKLTENGTNPEEHHQILVGIAKVIDAIGNGGGHLDT